MTMSNQKKPNKAFVPYENTADAGGIFYGSKLLTGGLLFFRIRTIMI